MSRKSVGERADRLRAEGVPFVHARVVLAERPTSAKPGDEAIVLPDGSIEGFVGGQCAQATVRTQGLAALASGSTVLLRISPVPEPDQVGKTVVHNPCLSGGTLEIFMEPVLPAPRVAVVGETPIARAMQVIGSALGYDIVEWSLASMRTTDAVVVATHGFDEEQSLVDAVKGGIPYIALVASPKRAAAVIGSLALDEDQRRLIKAPAGLDIGARTPEEVALSIFAEIIERRSEGATRAAFSPLSMIGDPVSEPSSVAVAIDPICKMSVGMVESSIHADVDGSTYWFCCPGCRTTFLSDPSAYIGS